MYIIRNLIPHPHSPLLQILVLLYTNCAILVSLIYIVFIIILIYSHPYHLRIYVSHINYSSLNSKLSISITTSQTKIQNQLVSHTAHNSFHTDTLNIQSPGKRSSIGFDFVTPPQSEIQTDVSGSNNTVPPKSAEHIAIPNQSEKNAEHQKTEPKESKSRTLFQNRQPVIQSLLIPIQSKQRQQSTQNCQPKSKYSDNFVNHPLLCETAQLSLNKYYRKLIQYDDEMIYKSLVNILTSVNAWKNNTNNLINNEQINTIWLKYDHEILYAILIKLSLILILYLAKFKDILKQFEYMKGEYYTTSQSPNVIIHLISILQIMCIQVLLFSFLCNLLLLRL